MQSFYSRFKRYQYTTLIPTLLILIDIGLIFLVPFYLSTVGLVPKSAGGETQFLITVVYLLAWVVSGFMANIYLIENLGTYAKIMRYGMLSGIIYGLITFLLFAANPSHQVSFDTLSLFYLTTLFVIVGFRLFMLFLYRLYRNLPMNHKKAIIIGYTPKGLNLYHYFRNNPSISNKLIGYFDDKNLQDHGDVEISVRPLEEVEKFCTDHYVQEIYYALSNHSDYLKELSKFADQNFIYLGIIPDVDTIDSGRKLEAQVYDDGRIPIISYRKRPLRLMINRNAKRLFDICFSTFVLFMLSWTVFPIIALAIRLDSPGPVFFKQIRPGLGNRPFWCYKFRTMHITLCSNTQQATRHDKRITRVGAFLRKTSLDELPQFFNVLRGDMSVVGPRPNLLVHLEQYGALIKDYSFRHTVMPGITGYAQISGFRGETRELYQMEQRVAYDLDYMENWSLTFDLSIIFRTMVNVFKGEENAY